MVLPACLALLVALGLLERFAARRARAAVPIRIHVNGTRGKSTVTRLVAAALREAGIPTLAKTTGTAARLIRADGSEHPVRRWAPASIREQAWLLREARRTGARALVAECMAVRPDLQWVSEREMVRATIGVITNVRLDHTEAMGRTVDEIAQSLANAIPRAGVLVTGDARFAETFGARCAPLGTRLVVAQEREASGEGRVASDNVAVALAVTRELGISDEVALRGMEKATPDPGAVTAGSATIGRLEVAWIDATAANDPESLDLLATGLPASVPLQSRGTAAVLTVYNHRADRPDRLRTFARFSATFRNSAAILLTGDRPGLTLVAGVRRLCAGIDIRFAGRRVLATAIATRAGESHVGRVIFCGNTRGFVQPFDVNNPAGAGSHAANDRDKRPTTNRPTTNDQD
jgi:poly-gamma-glutamate synthase PgsB/CapB